MRRGVASQPFNGFPFLLCGWRFSVSTFASRDVAILIFVPYLFRPLQSAHLRMAWSQACFLPFGCSPIAQRCGGVESWLALCHKFVYLSRYSTGKSQLSNAVAERLWMQESLAQSHHPKSIQFYKVPWIEDPWKLAANTRGQSNRRGPRTVPSPLLTKDCIRVMILFSRDSSASVALDPHTPFTINIVTIWQDRHGQ
jgi:hypothetical protein